MHPREERRGKDCVIRSPEHTICSLVTFDLVFIIIVTIIIIVGKIYLTKSIV
jgi:hypothetical protein